MHQPSSYMEKKKISKKCAFISGTMTLKLYTIYPKGFSICKLHKTKIIDKYLRFSNFKQVVIFAYENWLISTRLINIIIMIEYQLTRIIIIYKKCLSLLCNSNNLLFSLIQGSQSIMIKWTDVSLWLNPYLTGIVSLL